MTSQQPYQELQNIIRQKDAALAENEEIRRRLAQAVSLLQPLLGVHALPALSDQLSATTPTSATSLHHAQNEHQSMYQSEQYMTTASLPPRTVPTSSHHEASTFVGSFPPSENENSADSQSWAAQRMALANQRESMHRNHELSENGERLNFSFLIDATGINGVPSVSDRRNIPADRTAFNSLSEGSNQNQPWNMLPKTCPPTCPLDHILLNFLQLRQRENASYNSASGQSPAFSSPAYPSIANLLNPTNTTSSAGAHSPGYPRHTPHSSTNSAGSSTPRPSDPISSLMIDIISKFPHISGLPEQVAVLYSMFTHMRWWVYPTQENYDRMPDWMAPRPSQLVSPHPAWIEHIPWPKMRDKVVRNYQDYPFENWFLPFTSGLSVNWPYEPVDCLIITPEQDDPIINPVFQRHISRLDNWSIGPQFTATYPDLADTCTVREKVSSLGPSMDHGQIHQMSMPMRHGQGYTHPPQRDNPGSVG